MLRNTGAIGLAVLLAAPTASADDPDILRGKFYAQQLCAGCHAILADEAPSPLTAAPAFRRVAKVDAHTGQSFADWLGTAHPSLNGVAVKPAVAADILAYIRSLGPAKENAEAAPVQTPNG